MHRRMLRIHMYVPKGRIEVNSSVEMCVRQHV